MMDNSRRKLMSIGAMAAVVAAARPVIGRVHTELESSSSPDLAAADIVERAHAFLGSLNAAVLEPFLAQWPTTKERRQIVPSTLPVLRWLPEAESQAPAVSHELVHDLRRTAPSMAWRRTYTESQVGAAFLENYGWSEIAGLSGPLPSNKLACGFLVLGPSTNYPRHRHEAEEIYIPLSGTASWQQGNGPWRKLPPGTVIHHASYEPHAMKTGEHALLGLYLWRSENLNQKSQLD
jgi:hypothetical protein